MNAREKRLLIAFVVILLAVVHFYGFQVYKQKMNKLETDIGKEPTVLIPAGSGLKADRELALDLQNKRAEKEGEMAWLAENFPEPKEGLTVQSDLADFAKNAASALSLDVKKQDIQENDESGNYFHRAIFQINITGQEDSMYKWLVQLHDPTQFRAVTRLRLEPNREDDTLIDALVQVEQWYSPVIE